MCNCRSRIRTAEGADWIGGYEGGFAKKLEVAGWVAEEGLPLTINAVIHRANVAHAADMVDFAVRLGARRIEIAHTQYYGWALHNRAHLMPTREQSEKAYAEVEERARALSRQDRHRPCRARLSRQISQGLHERLGPADA